MADRRTFVSNSYQDELSFDLPEGGTTVEVNATVGSPGIPFFLVIDADDDNLREVVLVDQSKDDDTFLLSTPANRGLDGTVDVAHTAGALVGVYPIAAHWDDINDRVDAVQSDHDLHDHDGVDTPQVALGNVTGHDKAAHDSFRDVGEVIFYAGTSVPSGFLEADGQAVSRVTFADLFSEIGTTWGAGDGSTTFNVPDLQDAVPVGRSATKAVGDSGGGETHTHGNPSTDSGGSHGHTQSNTGSNGDHAHTNPSTGSAGNHQHSGSGWRTSSVGGHAHSNPNVASNGDHAHTNSSTGNAGGHGHGSAGSHAHDIPAGNDEIQSVGSGSALIVSDTSHDHDNTGSAGSHSHSSVSSHDHSVGNTGSNGNHSHVQANTGSGGGHDHSVPTSTSGGSHSHGQGNTGSNGDHAHTNPTTNASSGHTHAQADTVAGDSYPPYRALMALIRF